MYQGGTIQWAGSEGVATKTTQQLQHHNIAPSTLEKLIKRVERDIIKRTRFFTLCDSRNQAILWLESIKEKILLRVMGQDLCL
jgi:hypothetical protein